MTFTEEFMGLIECGENDIVKFILEDGSLHNSVIQPKKTIWYGGVSSTVLHYAAACENNELVSYLLSKGCDVDVADSAGNTPLMWLTTEAEGLGAPTTRLLLEAGADIYLKNSKGQDAIAVAIDADYPMTPVGSSVLAALMQELKKKYLSSEVLAEVLVSSYKCRIDQAVCAKDPALIKCMLERGISSTRQALHVAMRMNDVAIVELLLQRGADVREEDDLGEKPLDYLNTLDYPHGSETLEILRIFLTKAKVTTSEVSEVVTWKNAFVKKNICKILKNNAAEVIAEISGERLDSSSIPTQIIVNYLSDGELLMFY